jgi:hypothetical protein
MFCIPRNKIKIMVVFLTALILMAASSYSGYLYAEWKWSRSWELTSLMHIRENLEIIKAVREEKNDAAIEWANLGIESAAYTVQALDAVLPSEHKSKHRVLSSLQKEWQAHPYHSCVYNVGRINTNLEHRLEMEKICLELRQYINQFMTTGEPCDAPKNAL